MLSRIFVLICLAAFVSACAISPAPVSGAGQGLLQMPEAAHAAPRGPDEDKAKVMIMRDSGLLGTGPKAKILVDGKVVASLWSGEKVEFYLPLGRHTLGVVPESGLGGAVQETEVQFFKPGPYYFRFTISPTEGARLRRAATMSD